MGSTSCCSSCRGLGNVWHAGVRRARGLGKQTLDLGTERQALSPPWGLSAPAACHPGVATGWGHFQGSRAVPQPICPWPCQAWTVAPAAPANGPQMALVLASKKNSSRQFLLTEETEPLDGLSQHSRNENKNSSEVHFNSEAAPATANRLGPSRHLSTVGPSEGPWH